MATTHTQRGNNMASKPNPTPINLAGVAVVVGTLPANKVYGTRQAMLVAAHPALGAPNNKALCTSARQVLRGLSTAQAAQVFGNGCNSGYVHVQGSAITPAQWLRAYKLVQAAKASGQYAAQAAASRAQYGRKVGPGQVPAQQQ